VADQVPGSQSPGRLRVSNWQHDWYPYDSYLDVYFSQMRALENEGLALRCELTWTDIPNRRHLELVHIDGRIACRDDVLISVDKWLGVRRAKAGVPEVKGFSYSYHAWLRGSRELIVRYDCAHGLENLHRHWPDARGNERQRRIALDYLPTLDELVREAVEIRGLLYPLP
jgi:hypothetical protein